MPGAAVRAYIGLGANLGEPRAAIDAALAAIAALPRTTLVARSSHYRSAPVDAPGPDFINAVAAVDTRLEAPVLLQALHRIEQDRGRERAFHHAPRTLDLDLLTFGDERRADPRLTLPHPRLHLRAFVLEPLAELLPDLQLPLLGSIEPWRERACDQKIERLDPYNPAAASVTTPFKSPA